VHPQQYVRFPEASHAVNSATEDEKVYNVQAAVA